MDYYQLLTSAAFSIVGVASFIIAYFIFNLITPFDFSRELSERKNVAVAIVLAAIFLGIAHIIAAALY